MPIHPSVIIEAETQIAKSVSIDAFSIIRKGVIIGENTQVASHVEIAPYTSIGRNNQIYKGACIGGIAQDIAFQDQKIPEKKLSIGHDNIFREFTTIHHGTESETSVGDSNFFMAYSHIAHDCIIGNHVILANYAGLAGWVEVGNHVFISGHSLVHQYVRIGPFAMIGGLCKITQDVAPFSLIAQGSGKLAGINSVGLKRNGWNDDKLIKINRVFKKLFRNSASLRSGITKIATLLDEKEYQPIKNDLMALIDFMNTSKRGVINKWYHNKT